MTGYERTCQPSIVYGKRGDDELVLDLYLPEIPPERRPPSGLPLVIYMHGGGWVQGTRQGPSAVAFAMELTAEGFAFASVDYSLAPRHRAPAAIEDCKLAVRRLRATAADYGLDPDRFIAMGNSAGGHLAAMVGLTRPEDGFDGDDLNGASSAVSAVVDLCGITDVAELIDQREHRIWADAWIPKNVPDRQALARRCSPVTYAHADAPPFLLLHGDADEAVPHDQSRRLAAALEDAGAPATLVTIPGAGHYLSVTGPGWVQREIRKARRDFLASLGYDLHPAPIESGVSA